MKIFTSVEERFSPLARLAIEDARAAHWFELRYCSVISDGLQNYRWTRWWFYLFTTVITIGSVLMVMLSSLAAVGASSLAINIASIVVSTLVALANKFLYSGNNIQKRYIQDKIALERLQSEGWKYLAGAGKYRSLSLDDRFSRFVDRVELLRADYVSQQARTAEGSAVGSPNNTAQGGTSSSNSGSSSNSSNGSSSGSSSNSSSGSNSNSGSSSSSSNSSSNGTNGDTSTLAADSAAHDNAEAIELVNVV